MKQVVILTFLVVVMLGITFWVLTQNVTNPNEVPAVEVPATEEAATEDYLGLQETEAEALAARNGVMFRVIERDGELLPATRDYRVGRINAVVESGVVTFYTVEGEGMPATEPDLNFDAPKDEAHESIVGLTVAEAEAYAATNGVSFRLSSIDGEPRPLTMDYQPGRITADVVDGVVTAYSVE